LLHLHFGIASGISLKFGHHHKVNGPDLAEYLVVVVVVVMLVGMWCWSRLGFVVDPRRRRGGGQNLTRNTPVHTVAKCTGRTSVFNFGERAHPISAVFRSAAPRNGTMPTLQHSVRDLRPLIIFESAPPQTAQSSRAQPPATERRQHCGAVIIESAAALTTQYSRAHSTPAKALKESHTVLNSS
jgi:hypothetical protein